MASHRLRKGPTPIEYRLITMDGSEGYPSNKVLTADITFRHLALRETLKKLFQPWYIWFILLTILKFSVGASSWSLKLSTLTPLSILILSFSIRSGKRIYRMFKHDSKINSLAYKVWKNGDFHTKLSKDITVGDIVLLKTNEIFPADTLLIGTDSISNQVDIDISPIFQISHLISKNTIKETQKIFERENVNIDEFLSRVENIRVVSPNKVFDRFEGMIKLRGNPRNTPVTIQNFAPGGAVLGNCVWVLGIVVYTGIESKKWMNYKPKPFRRSRFESLVSLVMSFGFIVMILLSIINYLAGFKLVGWEKGDTFGNFTADVVVLYTGLVSISLFLCIASAKLIQTKLIQVRNKGVFIRNSKVLDELGQVEYLLTEKSNIVSEERIAVCLVQDEIFIDEEPLISSESSKLICEEIFENSSHRPIQNFASLKENIFQGLTKEKLCFLLSLLLCNQNTSDGKDLCDAMDDGKMAKLAKHLGGSLLSKSNNFCEVEVNEKIFNYDIIYSQNLCLKAKFAWTLLKDKASKEVILLVKSFSDFIFKLFHDEDLDHLEEILNNSTLQTVRKVIFGYKILTNNDLRKFKYDLKQAEGSSINKEFRIGIVVDKYVKDMNYLGIVGFEPCVGQEIAKSIQVLTEAGVKIWITTTDCENSAIVAGLRSGLFDDETSISRLFALKNTAEALNTLENIKNTEIMMKDNLPTKRPLPKIKYEIPFAQSEELLLIRENSKNTGSKYKPVHRRSDSLNSRPYKIKNDKARWLSLSYLKKNPFKKKNSDIINYALSVDSISFKTILSCKKALEQFVVLLFSAKTVFFYEISPNDISKIIKVLKQNFSFKPVVAVVLSEVEVPIAVSKSNIVITVSESLTHTNEYSDITIGDFSNLANLLLIEGQHSYYRLVKILHLFIFNSFCLATLLFLYQFKANFAATALISYDTLVVYKLLISFSTLLLTGCFDYNYTKAEIIQQPELYAESFLDFKFNKKKGLFVAFQGVVIGCLIFIFVIFGIGDIVNSKGFTEGFEMTRVVGLILLEFALLTKLFTISRLSLQLLLTNIVSLILLGVILIVICNGGLEDNSISANIFIDQTMTWVIICFFPLVTYIFLSLMNFQLKGPNRLLCPTRFQQYQTDFSKVFCASKAKIHQINENSLDIKKNTLSFASEIKEMEYRKLLFTSNKRKFRILFVGNNILLIVNTILYYFNFELLLDDWNYTFLPMIFQFVFTLAAFWKRANWKKLNIAYFAFIVTISFLDISHTGGPSVNRFPIIFIMFGLFMNFSWVISISQIAITAFLFIIFSIVSMAEGESVGKGIEDFHWVVSMAGILALVIIASYFRDLNNRKEFVHIQQIENKVVKSAAVLSYLLPEFVRIRVKKGVRYIAEDKGIISIIFCDICNFDKIVNIYSPSELTELLHMIFGEIDEICERLGVTKIETVGKTYLACTGLKDSEISLSLNLLKTSHARRAIEFGLSIIQETKKIILKDGSYLEFKIGINSGPATAGVVGYHKPQFSLVGDAVNTASRMASTLTEINCVQISRDTYELLENTDGLIFENLLVEVKGKGKMNTKIVKFPNTISNEAFPFSETLSKGKSSFANILSPGFRESLLGKKANRNNNHLLLLKNLEVVDEKDLLERDTSEKINRILSFSCKETFQENAFRIYLLKCNFEMHKIGAIVAVLYNAIFIIVEIVEYFYGINPGHFSKLIVLIIEEILTIIMILLSKKYRKIKLFSLAVSLIYALDLVVFFILYQISSGTFLNEVLNTYFRFLQINIYSGSIFMNSLYFSILITSLGLTVILMYRLNFRDISLSFVFIFLILIYTYSYEYQKRINFVLKEEADKEIEKTEELLSQLMPPHALKNFEEEKLVSEKHNRVTLLFADIVGFTAWSSSKTSQEVVGMLSELFTRFDKMCLEHRVYKVHTIGDCYVAMGYFDDRFRNPAKEAVNVMEFAASLLGVIEETNEKCGCALGMRIGIHTGDVTGGITGTNIVRYDIYGSDVMIANKMESNGVQGKLAVSGETKSLIDEFMPGTFRFDLLKELEIAVLEKSVEIYIATKLD